MVEYSLVLVALMPVLLTKLEVPGWSYFLLQGDVQHKFLRPKVIEFYANVIIKGSIFHQYLRQFHQSGAADTSRILRIPNEGWDN